MGRVAAAVAMCLAGTSAESWAQDTVPEPAPGEIVVTAQKRAENIQDVPVSITALTGKALEDLGVQRASDVVAQIANVGYQAPFGDSGAPVFNIRGVSTIDFGDSNEPSVSVYADEVYIGTPAGQNGQLFDLERVEVLRGPQGTLYGRNATGGLIHFLSRKPEDAFSASASVQYGSFDQRILEAALGGRVAPGVRARVAGKYNEDDGWQRNLVNDGRFNKTKTVAARGLVGFDLGRGEGLAKLHYSRSRGTYTGYGLFGTRDPLTGEACTAERIFAAECVNSSGFGDPDPDPRRIYSAARTLPNNNEVWGTSLRLTHPVGDAELTSVTAYEKISRYVTEDAAAAVITPYPLFVTYTTRNRQFSQELRLSRSSRLLDWVVGAYYFRDRRFVTNALPAFDLTDFADLHTRTGALFGQATVRLGGGVSATGGLRYTEEKRVLDRLAAVSGGVPDTRIGTPFFESSGRIKARRVTGRAALQWEPNDSLMAYASVGTGFKSGGFNTILVSSQAEVGPVKPERIIAYETGLKGRLFDRKAAFTIAAFYYDYSNIQAVGSAAGAGGVPIARFINAGDARVIGADADLSASPARHLRLTLGVGLLDTRIEADPQATFNGRRLDGNRLILAPSFNIKGAVRYEAPIGNHGFLSAQTDFQYQTRVYFGPDNQPTESQGAYGLANARLGWSSASRHYRVDAFVENLFNKKYFLYGADIAGINESVVVVWGRPRAFGVRLSVDWE